MKPKARRSEPNIPCIAWRCEGIKDGKYHVCFGGHWWEACKRWYETDPNHIWDCDIPF